MGRHVLFSFLGTGDYTECYYTSGDFEATYSRFTQTAIYELLSQEYQDLEVVMFVTKEAEVRNWNSETRRNNRTNKEVLYEGLEEAFQRIAPNVHVKKVRIPSTQNEQANWELFDIIRSEVEEGDQIYFDVTHSFRTIPILALIVLNYVRFIKNVTIGRLMYGLFDDRTMIKEGEDEKFLAPIIDFTSVTTLLDWTNGIEQFLRTGDASRINEITQQEFTSLRKQNKINKESEGTIFSLKSLPEKMEKVSLAIQTCRGQKISQEIEKLMEQINSLTDVKTDYMKALTPLIQKVNEKFINFGESEGERSVFIAEWCYEHGLTQQGYTLLQENIITAACRLCEINEIDKDKRKLVSASIQLASQKKEKSEWRGNEEEIEMMEHIVGKLEPYKEFFQYFNNLSADRNDINHAGMKNSVKKAGRLNEDLKKYIDQFRPFFIKIYKKINSKGE